jgi:hypothetical protein
VAARVCFGELRRQLELGLSKDDRSLKLQLKVCLIKFGISLNLEQEQFFPKSSQCEASEIMSEFATRKPEDFEISRVKEELVTMNLLKESM